MDPTEFEEREWQLLKSVADRSVYLRHAVEDIRDAFGSGTLPITFQLDTFRSWREGTEDASVFAHLLKNIGDYYLRKESPDKALARYAAAWSMDSRPEFALYVASVLRKYRSLDPERRLVNELSDRLFTTKGAANRAGDWASILRLHVILGTIYEQDRMWGPPDNPRSAYWQWSRASLAEQQVHDKDPNETPIPGIHQHLAMASQRLEKPEKAFDEYLTAAEGFMQISDPGSATVAWDRAEVLRSRTRVSAEQEARRQRVMVQLSVARNLLFWVL